jgi:hypothetical protein
MTQGLALHYALGIPRCIRIMRGWVTGRGPVGGVRYIYTALYTDQVFLVC